MSGRFTRSWSEAGASDARPLLRASSPLKTEKQPRTNTENWYSERGHFNILSIYCLLRPTTQLLHALFVALKEAQVAWLKP